MVPLMEDYDLVQRVKELGGGIRLIPCEEDEEVLGVRRRRSLRVITSARRWEEHGVMWTTVMNQVRRVVGGKFMVKEDSAGVGKYLLQCIQSCHYRC